MSDPKITNPRPAPGGVNPRAAHTDFPHENLVGNGNNHWNIPHRNENSKEAAKTITASLKGSLDKASIDKLAAIGAKVSGSKVVIPTGKAEAAKKILMGK